MISNMSVSVCLSATVFTLDEPITKFIRRLTWSISSHQVLKCAHCAAAKNCEKITKNTILGVSGCSRSSLLVTDTYLQSFSHQTSQ